MILLSFAAESGANENSWYFTAEQIEVAYRYQEKFGRRLQTPLKPRDCYFGKTEFVARFQGKEFIAPCSFIHQTIRHLKAMLEQGAAKHLFPLDADHAHLAVPISRWRAVYSSLDRDQLLPRLLRDPALVALYHTAEHLSGSGLANTPLTPHVKSWKERRNVLGFYDGRPIKILPPHPDGSGYELVENHQTVAGFFFLGHRLAELTVVASGKSHPFDLSFDDDLATEGPLVPPKGQAIIGGDDHVKFGDLSRRSQRGFQ